MPLPESVRLKILRAKEHRDAFLVATEAHLQSYADKLMVDVNMTSKDARFQFDAEVSPRIPIIMGDCIQNLRSALDYLVWELAAAKGVASEKNAFPICDTPERFRDSCRRGRLNGLTEEAVALVETLQPYHSGKIGGNPIWLLDKLTNINKHRKILLFTISAAWIGKFSKTSKYAMVTDSEQAMYMDVEPTAFLAIHEGGVVERVEVAGLLRLMMDGAERVIADFERFF